MQVEVLTELSFLISNIHLLCKKLVHKSATLLSSFNKLELTTLFDLLKTLFHAILFQQLLFGLPLCVFLSSVIGIPISEQTPVQSVLRRFLSVIYCFVWACRQTIKLLLTGWERQKNYMHCFQPFLTSPPPSLMTTQLGEILELFKFINFSINSYFIEKFHSLIQFCSVLSSFQS